MKALLIILILVILSSTFGYSMESMDTADMAEMPEMNTSPCVVDYRTAMCAPLPMPEMPDMKTTELMVHGNIFGVGMTEQGPRGRRDLAGPDMFMLDGYQSVGTHQMLNLEYMGTIEKWTFPDRGYPLLLQIGENDSQGRPFIDAQHPHSSPVMGLTLNDLITLGDTSESSHFLRLSFAPRGASTDGPIPFMHRITGEINPDAPLGHHIGQDVGHISSTVFGAAYISGDTQIEASTFHGAEPQPENIDLPLGNPDSGALRLDHKFSPSLTGMASFAYVQNPEPDTPIPYELRYSASAYSHYGWGETRFDNSLIFGAVTQYDHAGALYSFAEEFKLAYKVCALWGRAELLQRTASELGISSDSQGRWVNAWTLGYTHTVLQKKDFALAAGLSGTKDLLPGEFIGAYGGNPWTGKVFLELSGMKMGTL